MMNTARFQGSPTELHSKEAPPEQSQVTLVRGRPPLPTPSQSLDPSEHGDADVEDSPIARLILSQERSRLTRPSTLDPSLPTRIDRAKGLPVTVLTDDPTFAHQIRTALDNTSEVTAVGTADEAAELAVCGRCPILVTDTVITRGAIEQLTARLRSHDPAMVFIVAGKRDQGGMCVSLQSSGIVDGFLLKPPTAGATQLVVESATKRHRACDGGDSICTATRVRSRTRTPRADPSMDDATALATPTIEAHAHARATQTVTPLVTTDHRPPRGTMPRPSWPIVIAALAAVGGIVWWITWQQLPDIDPQRVITEQLALADSAQQAGRWVGTRNSATYYYQTVLALDPNNLAAQRGLDRVAAELSRRTQTAMSRQHLAEAAASLERLREIQPEYPELPLLDSQLRVLRDSVLAAHSPAPAFAPVQTPRVESPPVRQRTATRTIERALRADRLESLDRSPLDRSPSAAAVHEGFPLVTGAEERPSAASVHGGFPLVTGAGERPPPIQKPAAATQEIIETKSAPQQQTANTVPAPVALPQPTPSSNATATQQDASAQSTVTPPAATVASNTAPNIPATISVPATIEPQTSSQTSLQSSAPEPTAAAPKILKYVAPVYPNEAYARGIEGWVQVSLQVAPNGSIAEVRVEDGVKRQLFSRAALAAVKQWQYEPNPHATTQTPVTVRLDFQLDR